MKMSFQNSFSHFGNRLKSLMEKDGIDLSGKSPNNRLAKKLIGTVFEESSDEILGSNKSPLKKQIENVGKTIRRHMNEPDPEKIDSNYMFAYSKYFKCSADFLFGYIDKPTHDIGDASEITGLHPDTVKRLIEMHNNTTVFDKDQKPYKHFIDYVITSDELLDAINRYCFVSQTDQIEFTIPTFDESIDMKAIPKGYTLVNDSFDATPSDIHRVKTAQPVIANGYRIDTLLEEAAFKILQKCIDNLSETLKKEYSGQVSQIDKRYL